MNNIRDTLTNMINLKLPHGGYSGTGQQLKNEIETKASKSGDTFTGPIRASKGIGLNLNEILSFNAANSGVGWGIWERSSDGMLIIGKRSGTGEYQQIQKINTSGNTFFINDIYANGNSKVYHATNKPSKSDVGLENVDNTSDDKKDVLSATKLKTARLIGGVPFDGSKNIELPGVDKEGTQNAPSANKLKTARNIVIGNKSYTFDGQNDISYSLQDIGAISRNGDSISSKINFGINVGQVCFGIGQGFNFRMYETADGILRLNSYRDNGEEIYRNSLQINHNGEITIDNGNLPLINTLKQHRTDLDFLGTNKLDRTNGTYNGFLKFGYNTHGIEFNGPGLGYKIYEQSSSGALKIEHTHNGVSNGSFSYLDGSSTGRILTSNGYCPFPVGGVYISSSITNPATIWQGTTWKRILGRDIIGVDENQSEFNSVNKEGGSKTHTLIINEIPSHIHRARRSNNAGGSGKGNLGGSDSPDSWNDTSSTGGGQAHNNLQPYITKYIWERTA